MVGNTLDQIKRIWIIQLQILDAHHFFLNFSLHFGPYVVADHGHKPFLNSSQYL